MSKYSKLTQDEGKTRHELVGKVTHWQLSKGLKFEHINEWYMHKPESILENETNEIL